MNKVFKVIWSSSKRLFVVVSELNASAGKEKSHSEGVDRASIVATKTAYKKTKLTTIVSALGISLILLSANSYAEGHQAPPQEKTHEIPVVFLGGKILVFLLARTVVLV